jgi:hypothetical protein
MLRPLIDVASGLGFEREGRVVSWKRIPLLVLAAGCSGQAAVPIEAVTPVAGRAEIAPPPPH